MVSVVFVDLVGSTARADGADPEDVDDFLDAFHAVVREAVVRHGGRVDQLLGDGALCVFGAPSASGRDAERAIRCGLAVLAACEARWPVRIGIASGRALVRSLDVAGDHSLHVTLTGDVVNTSRRVQEHALPGTILIDGPTRFAVAERFVLDERAPLSAKGKRGELPVWRVVEPRASTGIDVDQSSRAPLVGRAAEFATLRAALRGTVLGGKPSLITLFGEPGIGKSRLVWELYAHVRDAPELIAWRQGRSLPLRGVEPLSAFAEIVRAEAGITGVEPGHIAKARLAKAVDQVLGPRAGRAWVTQHLCGLLGHRSQDATLSGQRQTAFAAYRAFLEALASDRPTVLVFEDVHWADDALLDFIGDLAERATDCALLVLCTARPELLERRPDWGYASPRATTLNLRPLRGAEATELGRATLRAHGAGEDRVERVVELAAGVPLYAEEYARLLAAGGGTSDEIPLPDTLEALIAARLDLLDAASREIVAAAAVFGPIFWEHAIAALTGRAAPELAAGLEGAERVEILRRQRSSSIPASGEYGFRHALIRDVAYGQIVRRDRLRLHLAAADWLDSLGTDAARTYVPQRAHHLRTALELHAAIGTSPTDQLKARTRDALTDAAEHAARIPHYATAYELFAEAVALTAADDPRRPRLLLACGEAGVRAEAPAAVALLEEAQTRLLAASDRAGAALALLERSRPGNATSRDVDTAARREDANLQAVLRLLEGTPPSRTRAIALTRRAVLRCDWDTIGGFESASELASKAIEEARTVRARDVEAFSLELRGRARLAAGDLRGLDDSDQAAAIADAAEAPGPGSAAVLGNHASTVAEWRGVTRALAGLVVAERVAARVDAGQILRGVRGNRATFTYLAGDLREAAHLAASASDGVNPEPEAVAALVACAHGDLANARTLANRARIAGVTFLASSEARRAAATAAAVVSLLIGDADQARSDLAWALEHRLGYTAPMIARVARALDEAAPFRSAARGAHSPWVAAALLEFDGEAERAATAFRGLGSVVDEAHAYETAAVDHGAYGRTRDAARCLARAKGIWTRIGADGYRLGAESPAAFVSANRLSAVSPGA
jgi:class 3 adenylate cyclase